MTALSRFTAASGCAILVGLVGCADARQLAPEAPLVSRASHASALGANVVTEKAAIASDAGTLRQLRTADFQPSGIAFDGRSFLVSNNSGPRMMHTVNEDNGVVTDSTPLGGNPSDMARMSDGSLLISDISGWVSEYAPDGSLARRFVLPFRGGALAFDGRRVYVADIDASTVLVTELDGTRVTSFQLPGLRPAGMVYDSRTGHIWSVDEFTSIVSQVTTSGRLLRQCVGPRTPGPQGLGAVTTVGKYLAIVEASDPDPFDATPVAGTIFIVDPRQMLCTPGY